MEKIEHSVECVGDIIGKFKYNNNKIQELTICNVSYVPSMSIILFSITKYIDGGSTVKNSKWVVILERYPFNNLLRYYGYNKSVFLLSETHQD